MKKFFILLLILIFPNFVYSFEIPKDLNIHQPHFAMSVDEALNQDRPFLLVFASSYLPGTLVPFVPVGEMIYKNFENDYNFSIVNVEFPEQNREALEFFKPDNIPAVYIVDAKNNKYLYIEKRYYDSYNMKKILTKYKEGIDLE